MAGIPLYRLLFSFFLVLCVIIAGCSDESAPADATAPTPAHPDAKYGEGDIIATASSSGESSLYLILRYDPVTLSLIHISEPTRH